MPLKLPKQFLLFLGLLLVINLVQSFYTELLNDEAYYWYYAQQMAWGYFDHPPMVALLIKIGSFFSSGELGVRLVSCLLSAGTAIILWEMIDDDRKKDHIPLFFILLFAMPLVNAYGFFTLPDTPLLFFTSLFLWGYQRFLKKETLLLALFLGCTMAGMMYSKYHGALIIIFVLLSNLGVIKNKLAWLAVGFALLLFMPHMWWLYEHDFVTLIFHMSERPNQPYTFSGFTLGYLLNLAAIFGLVFPWVYWALGKAKATDKFVRALLFLTYGFIIFFFISSFNRRTQAQWLITICIPLFIITYRFLLNHDAVKKWLVRIGLCSALILVYARFWLVNEPLLPLRFETHGNRAWAAQIQNTVGDLPVVFENTYRYPSKYRFYTGNDSFTLTNLFGRHSQYSIDNSESKVQGKKIAYLSYYYPAKDFTLLNADGRTTNGSYFDPFYSYEKLNCSLEGGEIASNAQRFTIKIFNPYDFDIPTKELSFSLGYMNAYKQMKSTQKLLPENPLPEYFKSQDSTIIGLQLPKNQLKSFDYVRIGIAIRDRFPGLNSKPYPIDASGTEKR